MRHIMQLINYLRESCVYPREGVGEGGWSNLGHYLAISPPTSPLIK